jgi:hypothetical protein
MRRLISTLAAGLLAGGTVLAGGIASAGTGGTASAGAALVHHRATSTCTNEGPFYFNVTNNGANYFLGTPNNTSSGAAAILKSKKNSTTLWTLCVFPTSDTVVFQNRNLALTSRSTSPGTVVTMTGVGNGGDGYASQRWNYAFASSSTITFQNAKTGLFLRVRNSGPKIGDSVTTGFTPTDWTISQ